MKNDPRRGDFIHGEWPSVWKRNFAGETRYLAGKETAAAARKDDRRHGGRYGVQDAHVSWGYRESAVSIYDLDKISLLAARSVSYRSYYSNVPDAKCWLTTMFGLTFRNEGWRSRDAHHRRVKIIFENRWRLRRLVAGESIPFRFLVRVTFSLVRSKLDGIYVYTFVIFDKLLTSSRNISLIYSRVRNE